jgi:hypothetical protein
MARKKVTNVKREKTPLELAYRDKSRRGPIKGSPEAKKCANTGTFRKGDKRASLAGQKGSSITNGPAGRYRPFKQLLTDILSKQNDGEPTKTNAQVLMERVYTFAQAGESWAVHFLGERVEGKVPNVIRADTRRRYEELDGEELKRTLLERLERLRRIGVST